MTPLSIGYTNAGSHDESSGIAPVRSPWQTRTSSYSMPAYDADMLPAIDTVAPEVNESDPAEFDVGGFFMVPANWPKNLPCPCE
jgi:hypothetical protein